MRLADSAIFTVDEYEALYRVAGRHKINLSSLLYTGTRYNEALLIQEHDEFILPTKINLPAIEEKGNRTIIGRQIRLSNAGTMAMRLFINESLPNRASWLKNLKRWAEKSGFPANEITTKITRRTYEVWLFHYFRNISNIGLIILQSQGHTRTVPENYFDANFTIQQINQMKPYVEGWI